MGTDPASSSARLRAISRAIVRERRNAGSLARFPGALPAGLDEAYKVQALSRGQWPDQVIGWKVGGIPPIHREALGADYLSGPIYARRFFRAVPGERTSMPVFKDGFAAIEPEFIMMMGRTPDQDRVFIGAEIASSPIVDINGVGPLAVVCDFGNNNGLLLGPEITNWMQMDGVSVPVTTEIDAEIVGEKTVNDLPSAVTRSRAFLCGLAEKEGFALPAGTFISTGAITGVHDAACGACSTLHFGVWGTLEIELVPEQPFV
ncbi:MAG: 2-keto-4-pentenoate hydratase [Pseudomonadota bacterium]